MKNRLMQQYLGNRKRFCQFSGRRYSTDRFDVNFASMWDTSDHKKLSEVRETLFGYGDTAMTFKDGVDIIKDQFTELGEFEGMPHVVGVHPLIQKITEIDGLRQVISMQGSLIFKWYESSLENEPQLKNIPVTKARVPCFPKLSTAINQSVEPPLFVTHMRLPSDQPGIVTATYKWKAEIEAPFNYRKFPFDKQAPELVFWFREANITSQPDYARYFIPYDCTEQDGGTGVCILPPTSIAAEWKLFQPICFSWTRTAWGSTNQVEVQGIKLEIPLVRKSGFYVNLMTIQLDLAVLSLCCLVAFPIGEFATRISATFSLLVALIAFKFSVGEKLPKVAYTTWFDIYFYLVFHFLCFMAMYFTALKLYKDYYDSLQDSKVICDKDSKENNEKDENSTNEKDENSTNEKDQNSTKSYLPEPEYLNTTGAYVICAAWIAANIVFRLHARNGQRALEAALGKEILPMHLIKTRFSRNKQQKKGLSFMGIGKN